VPDISYDGIEPGETFTYNFPIVQSGTYWFHSHTGFQERGDVSARLEAEYELLLTNYLILTPSMEINVAFSGDEETGVGSGFNDIELGVRLGYDLIDRSFSPYLGFLYERNSAKQLTLPKVTAKMTKPGLL